jgi:sulfatase modifying factor 1
VTYARAGAWLAVPMLLAACADVLGLSDAHPIPNQCISTDECGPKQACEYGHCRSLACTPGERRCNVLATEVCGGDGTWSKRGAACTMACQEGACFVPPSCELDPRCGNEQASCCESKIVPKGSFLMASDTVRAGVEWPVDRNVSEFAMDRFEVTIGRFARFLEAYAIDHLPNDGAGAHHELVGSGWDSDWNDAPGILPRSQDSMRYGLNCGGQSFSSDPRDMPVGCVSWHLAFAFCLWDGGRLPTEAEWSFSAMNGEEQRIYPWSKSDRDDAITDSQACYSDIEPAREQPDLVGQRPMGAGAYGQEDLAGNLWEWTADWYHVELSQGPCRLDVPEGDFRESRLDCQELEPSVSRVQKGGSFLNTHWQLENHLRGASAPEVRDRQFGFRCVRDSN